MQEVKVRLEFLLKDIETLKKTIFNKTEEELKKNTIAGQINYTKKYYDFCCIEVALVSAKNYAEKFLNEYCENTDVTKD